MRYPASSLRWVRPLTSVICLFDGEVLPLALDGVPVGRTTRGHRFLSPGEICVGDAADYLEKLQRAYVILDQDQPPGDDPRRSRRAARRSGRRRQTGSGAARRGHRPRRIPGRARGRDRRRFHDLAARGAGDGDAHASEIFFLRRSRRQRRRRISCSSPTISPTDGGKTIVAGNERVLRARLADARFFWDQDRKIRLEDRVEALKERVYPRQARQRATTRSSGWKQLAEFLAVAHVPGADWHASSLRRRAALARQGRSVDRHGRRVSRTAGDHGPLLRAARWRRAQRVADAIADHYRPLGPNDTCPTAPVSIVVALADKIDTLWSASSRSARSRPARAIRSRCAARRWASSVSFSKIDLRLPLRAACSETRASDFADVDDSPDWITSRSCSSFIADRLKVHLREQGVRHDLIAAVFAQVGDARTISSACSPGSMRSQTFLPTDDGANLLIAYRRAVEHRRDRGAEGRRVHMTATIDPALLRQPEEQALADRLGRGWTISAGSCLARRGV